MAVQKPKKNDDTPAPVNIVDTAKPIPVILEDKPSEVVDKRSGKTLAPTTTEQEDITTEGQRKVNLIWEVTQSRIAMISIISSVVINIIVIFVLLFKRQETSPETIAVITACIAAMNLTVGIIIGFYFSRTNHQAIGGIGHKPTQKYEGR